MDLMSQVLNSLILDLDERVDATALIKAQKKIINFQFFLKKITN